MRFADLTFDFSFVLLGFPYAKCDYKQGYVLLYKSEYRTKKNSISVIKGARIVEPRNSVIYVRIALY